MYQAIPNEKRYVTPDLRRHCRPCGRLTANGGGCPGLARPRPDDTWKNVPPACVSDSQGRWLFRFDRAPQLGDRV